MNRVVFDPDLPVPLPVPDRTDVACFVGLVRPRAATIILPPSKQRWLVENGWLGGAKPREVSALLDVPIPVESVAGFGELFDDGTSAAAEGTDYLAAAVAAFFAQGGKKAYVVRVGDPVSRAQGARTPRVWLPAVEAAQQPAGWAALPLASVDQQRLLGLPSALDSLGDQTGWHGVAHLWGLPDVSFLVLPDLPVLNAAALQVVEGKPSDPTSGPEQFVECLPGQVTPELPPEFPLPAPRLTPDGYQRWGDTVTTVTRLLALHELREVQLVAALPLPHDVDAAAALELPSAEVQAADVHDGLEAVFRDEAAGTGASSAFVQLAYPWLRSPRARVLLEGLEPPDGTLVGLLARNALARGTFISAAKLPPADVVDVTPPLPAWETAVPDRPLGWRRGGRKPLVTRVSLFGFTPAGIRLLSDVTTFAGESYRQGRVNRLVSVVSRAARRFGQDHVFDHNGPALWASLRHTLAQLLTRLWSLGALEGATPADAFEVRCDRGTMTQNDLDEGRLVAMVSFQAAAVIELVRVTLTVNAGVASPVEIQAQLQGGV
jgi:hypothetical protein